METMNCFAVRTHNLKGFNVSIPLGKWVAVTGVSGSGKSSLVFDTIYAESQRRFLETLGTYERQFLQGLPQGDFESIDNIPAAVALKQSNRSSDPRSVIATAADILHPLLVVFASLMNPSCAVCGSEVLSDKEEALFSFIKTSNFKNGIVLAVPMDLSPLQDQETILKTLILEGFTRIISNNKIFSIEEILENKKSLQHLTNDWHLILDRVHGDIDPSELKNRVDQSWSQVRYSSQFKFIDAISIGDLKTKKRFFVFPYCQTCESTTKIIELGHLDWTSALGACSTCNGIGNVPIVDSNKVIPDTSKSIEEGAIKVWNSPTFKIWNAALIKELKRAKIPIDTSYQNLSNDVHKWIWDGQDPTGRLRPGGSSSISINAFFKALEAESYKPQNRILLSKYRSYCVCTECQGTRLSAPGRNAKCSDQLFFDLFKQQISETYRWLEQVNKDNCHSKQWEEVGYHAEEALKKLSLLKKLGLGSAHLGRRCRTLSGGEYQRVLLSKVLGNGLSNAIYILDEPSVGLGSSEVKELIPCLRELRDQGNTVLVVEHDPALVQAADVILELGPGGGALGGHLLPSGSVPESLVPDATAMRSLKIPIRSPAHVESSLTFPSGSVDLLNFSQHNCKNLIFQCPLGYMTVVAGPSGAGKSTLLEHGLLGAFDHFENHGFIAQLDPNETMGTWERFALPARFFESNQVVSVEQKPLSRSNASVVATVLGIMDFLREVFSSLDDSKRKRFNSGHFSFNSLGACPECEGRGYITDDLFFLGEVEKTCPECGGSRFKSELRQIKLQGKSIDEWMADDLVTFNQEFPAFKKIQEKIHLAITLGLGHLSLATSTTNISGGEAQRLRLAAALGKSKKRLFCIIDEPTRGLSEKDVSQLLKVFRDLCSKGNTFIIVEHHELFKKYADQLYEMGPGGGLEGGRFIHREVFF